MRDSRPVGARHGAKIIAKIMWAGLAGLVAGTSLAVTAPAVDAQVPPEPTVTTPPLGGPPAPGVGYAAESRCPPGMVLTGIRGETRVVAVSTTVAVARPVCADPTNLGVQTLGAPMGDAGGGQPGQTQCPAGQLVVGIQGRQGDFIDHVAVRCQPLAPTGAPTIAAPFGGDRGTPAGPFDCPDGGGPAVGFEGEVINWNPDHVRSLALLCVAPDSEPEPDRDGDDVADTIDNCPEVTNPDQADGYGDGIGDACDAPPADTTPPVLTVPASASADATGPAGAAVTYDASAADDTDPDPTVVCAPPSGAPFSVGTTTVTCTATDDAGNVATGAFPVVVSERATVAVLIPGIDPLANVNAPRDRDPVTTLADRGLFGPLLAGLGCSAPAPNADPSTTIPCRDPNMYWSAYSFAGVDDAGIPRPYRGFDTHQPLDVSAGHLQDLVTAIRAERGAGTNIVVIGFSLGGTVAARWASVNSATDVPVITLASPVYGMWPDARSTGAAEDFDWYCNPFTAGRLAEPTVDTVQFQALCLSWPVGVVQVPRVGTFAAGYRSAVSYDWRTGVFTGPATARDLLLLNVGNRQDMVAPVFWEMSRDARAMQLADCTTDQGHGCVKSTPRVIASVARVVGVARAAASSGQRPDPVLVASNFNQGVAARYTQVSQLDGYTVEVRVPAGWRVTHIGERVVTYGAAAADDRATVTCLSGATVTRLAPSRIRIRWPDWRPHALVVRARGGLPVDFQATARVVPLADPAGDLYTLDLAPLPGASAGACPVP